jgi:hypothetical protein
LPHPPSRRSQPSRPRYSHDRTRCFPTGKSAQPQPRPHHGSQFITDKNTCDDVSANKSLYGNERETPSTRSLLNRVPLTWPGGASPEPARPTRRASCHGACSWGRWVNLCFDGCRPRSRRQGTLGHRRRHAAQEFGRRHVPVPGRRGGTLGPAFGALGALGAVPHAPQIASVSGLSSSMWLDGTGLAGENLCEQL